MEIFFDGVLINTDNYMSYEESFKSFESNFYLGSIASLSAKLQVPLEVDVNMGTSWYDAK